MALVTMKIRINGTNENPWHRMGMKQNPFPQLGKAEYDRAEMMINSLDGDPIKGPEDIRERLKGFDPEFIEGCIKRYRPGERVEFTITFPEERRNQHRA
jgi:hypothetical protein